MNSLFLNEDKPLIPPVIPLIVNLIQKPWMKEIQYLMIILKLLKIECPKKFNQAIAATNAQTYVTYYWIQFLITAMTIRPS